MGVEVKLFPVEGNVQGNISHKLAKTVLSAHQKPIERLFVSLKCDFLTWTFFCLRREYKMEPTTVIQSFRFSTTVE